MSVEDAPADGRGRAPGNWPKGKDATTPAAG